MVTHKKGIIQTLCPSPWSLQIWQCSIKTLESHPISVTSKDSQICVFLIPPPKIFVDFAIPWHLLMLTLKKENRERNAAINSWWCAELLLLYFTTKHVYTHHDLWLWKRRVKIFSDIALQSKTTFTWQLLDSEAPNTQSWQCPTDQRSFKYILHIERERRASFPRLVKKDSHVLWI